MSTPNPEAPRGPQLPPGLYRWDGKTFRPATEPRTGPVLFAIGCVIASFVVGLAIGHGGAGSASAPSAATTVAPTTAATPTPAPIPLALSGQGSKVVQVDLGSGSYKVAWSAQGHDNFIVTLHGSTSDVHLINEIPPAPASGEAFLKVSDSGTYPMEVQAATLSWSLTFTRI